MANKLIVPPPRLKFFDEDGNPLAGGKVFTYLAGSTTKTPTYTDHTGLTPNTNPIILDANGECDAWLPSMIETSDSLPPGPPGPMGPPGVAGPPGSTGNTAEFSTITDFSSYTIYNEFNGFYVELVPAQGLGVGIIPVMVAIQYHFQNAAFATNSADFELYWGDSLGTPIQLPNGVLPAIIMEGNVDKTLILLDGTGLAGETLTVSEYHNVPLTLNLSAAPDGPPLLGIAIEDGGASYAIGDTGTIDGGDGNATYVIDTVVAGVVTEITLTDGGTGYVTATTVTTATGGAQPGVGSGLILTVYSAEQLGSTLRVTTWYRKNVILT